MTQEEKQDFNYDDYLSEIEYKLQDGNDMICEFLGAKIVGQGMKEQWQFPEGVCPPFGYIPRWAEGKRCMMFHTNLDWLIVAIEKCYNVSNKMPESKPLYDKITFELTGCFYPLFKQNTHRTVIYFIEWYNKTNNN